MNNISKTLKVLIITSEWPTGTHPEWATFIVDQVESLRAIKVQVDVFPFRGSKNPINYFISWVKVRAKLFQDQYDLIHAHFGQSGLLALPKTVPLAVTFHGSDLQGYPRTDGSFSIGSELLQVVSRFMAHIADANILVSEHLLSYMPDGCDSVTIPCGVNFSVFRPIRREDAVKYLGLDKRRRYILFPANPDRVVKRYSLAEETIRIVQQSFPDVELLSLTNVSHSKVPYFINASQAILLTSFQEGSPMVVKEALACNTPVVSVDVGDVRKVTENIDGCRICTDDPEDLTDAVIDVLENHEKIESRDKVEFLDVNIVAKSIFEQYQKLIRQGK